MFTKPNRMNELRILPGNGQIPSGKPCIFYEMHEIRLLCMT